MTREEAVMRTIQAYLGEPFVWGFKDCVRLAATNLRLLGYNPGLARGGHYTTEFGAARALRRAGFTTTEAWMDDVVGFRNRIDAKDARRGDVLGFYDGTSSMTALSVSLGGPRVLGFYSDEKCHIIDAKLDLPGVTYLAWRCDPRGA